MISSTFWAVSAMAVLIASRLVEELSQASHEPQYTPLLSWRTFVVHARRCATLKEEEQDECIQILWSAHVISTCKRVYINYQTTTYEVC